MTDGHGASDRNSQARQVELAFARCFSGPQGEVALAHLRRMTFERFLGPEASEAALRHLDGQRQLVATIAALVERGRSPGRPAACTTPDKERTE